jgi:HlyD family secretion protein
MIYLKKIKKWIWIIIGAAVLAAALILWVTIRKHASGSVKYAFTKVERGDIENTISSTGTLSAKGTVEVGTQVSGTVSKVYVDFNDKVRKGQYLAILDTTTLAASVRDADANLAKVQAQYDLALSKYEDAQELYQNDLIAKIDFQTAKTDCEVARASLSSAQANSQRAYTNLKYAVIRSPINGTVINRTVEPGQTVAASFSTPTLFVITEDLSRMEIHADVDESDIGQIKQGQTVRFSVDAYPDDTFSGTVRQIRLQPETIQNVVNYTVVIDAMNDTGVLLPGMTATIDFIIDQKKNVLLIANSALQFKPTAKMLAADRAKQQNGSAPYRDSSHGPSLHAQGVASAQGDHFAADSSPDMRMLWYFDEGKKLRAFPVRIGVSDGKNTEIVEARGLKEGMEFINGTNGNALKAAAGNNDQPNRMHGPPSLF